MIGIPEVKMIQHIEECRQTTLRNKVDNAKKLLAFAIAKKILLYRPPLKWFLANFLKMKSLYQSWCTHQTEYFGKPESFYKKSFFKNFYNIHRKTPMLESL